jgi:hypothetical protein
VVSVPCFEYEFSLAELIIELGDQSKSATVGTINRVLHGIICYDFPTRKWLPNGYYKMMNNE